jgi:hypothetical protein
MTKSVLLMVTDSSVLAALNPVGGLFGFLLWVFFDECSLDVQFRKYQNGPSFFISLCRSLILVRFFVLGSSSTIRPSMRDTTFIRRTDRAAPREPTRIGGMEVVAGVAFVVL